MLDTHLKNLEHSIIWAQQQDDIEVLCLARDNMDRLLHFTNELPVPTQLQVQQKIDQLLPMEWPLWMEACRYENGEDQFEEPVTLH